MRIGLCLASTDFWYAWSAYDFGGLIGHTVAQRPDLDLRRFLATGCNLPDQREQTTTAALRAGCDAVCYLDTDMRYPPNALVRLLAHDLPAVGVNYTQRKPPFLPVSVRAFGDPMSRVFTEQESSGLERVAATGLGCFLIRTEALALLKPPRFMIGWVPDDQLHTPEDFYFCRKLAEAGVPIQIDHDLSQEVRHLGLVEFEAQHAVTTRDALKPRIVA